MVTCSIITVCLNARNELERTADSIKSQDSNDFEWIVIDGGSTDGTPEFLNSLSFITELRSEPDDGIYDAMNKGIALATGRYCLFLNAGDYLYSRHTISSCLEYLKSDIVVGWINIVYPEQLNKETMIKKIDNQKIGRKYMYHRPIPHQSSFIKRKLFDYYGYYNTEYKICGDRDFFCRTLNNGASLSFAPLCVSNFFMDGISTIMNGTELYNQEIEKYKKENFTKIYRIRRSIIDPIENLSRIISHKIFRLLIQPI